MNGRKDYRLFTFFNMKIFDFYRSELVHVMRSIGNKLSNSIWEANTKNRVKPHPTAISYV